MGSFYSTVLGYFYPPPQSSITPLKVQLAAKKLKHTLRLKEKRLKDEHNKKEQELLQKFSEPTKSRAKQIQRTLLNQQIIQSFKFAVYEELILSCDKIQREADIIALDSSKISNQAFLAICNLIHAYKDLQLDEVVDLNQFVPFPRPQISQKQLSQDLRAFLNPKEPNEVQRNIYVIQMLQRNEKKVINLGLSLEKISTIGHKFELNPPTPPVQSWSSAMYAIDYEDVLKKQEAGCQSQVKEEKQQTQQQYQSNIKQQQVNFS